MTSDEPKWLTLAEAAAKLGIHPTTLRRWADNGSIPVYITPGGHRRFLESDVTVFVRHQAQTALPDTQQVWVDYALVETRQRLRTSSQPGGLAAFGPEQRAEQRELGNRLLNLIMQHITTPGDDERLLAEARGFAVRYAQSCLAAGLSATDGLEIILFFRDSLTEAAMQMPQVAHFDNEAKVQLLRKINQVFNTIQLGLVDYYHEQASGEPGNVIGNGE
jgi:excisionase family DNA binding protein